jgi:glycine hydroxymethyltransferase
VSSKVFEIIEKEKQRQEKNVELIASENFVSDNVLKAVGSCVINKYSEGYAPNNDGNKGRYYGGCQYIDELEVYCCQKWKEVFNTDYHVNVQPHSGSQANFAAYMSILEPNDKILAMDLNNGGHLTHGSSVNFSGKLYNFEFYRTDSNGYIDYDDLKEKIVSFRPKLVVVGASAYPRIIEFKKIRELIDEEMSKDPEYKCYFMVDMAHIAGLVAAGQHPSPFGLADIITTTTQKTLRGARGGMIFCKKELAKKVDSALFPGSQGGPLQNMIAGKAVAAEEALTDEYKQYIKQVVVNAKAMANEFVKLGYKVVTGGTDNHMFLLDLTDLNISGKVVQDLLDEHFITVNKNCVPNEKRSPKETSGVRIGTPAMTTKGWVEKDFIQCADNIDKIIKDNFN